MFFERSLLVLGAHPDDAVLGAGALIARCTRAGIKVKIITLTSGELAGNPLEREAEDREAAALLGATVSFARLPDGGLEQRDVIKYVRAELERIREPFLVLAHDPNDTHQDHIAVGRAASVVCRNMPNLYYYESPSSIAFAGQSTIPCDEHWAQKADAMRAYVSQHSLQQLVEWTECTARYRAWPRHSGSRCEAFRVHHADLGTILGRTLNETITTVSGDFAITRAR